VVPIHLDHRESDRDAGDVDLLGRLHHPVEKLELFRLQGLEDPSPHPGQRCPLLDEPGADAKVLGRCLAVGEATGVLVDSHQEKAGLFGGGLDAAFAEELGDDRAGGANRPLEDLVGRETVLLLFHMMVDQDDRTAGAHDEVVDLTEPCGAARVHHHRVLDPLGAGLS